MVHLHTPTAKATSDALIAILTPLAQEGIAHTVTADNGLLFADHERVTKATGASPYSLPDLIILGKEVVMKTRTVLSGNTSRRDPTLMTSPMTISSMFKKN